MKTNSIWMAVLAASISVAQADEHSMAASAVMPAGHDHTAMMGRPMAWTNLPILKAKMSGKTRETTVISIAPQNIVVANIDAWSNDLKDANAHRQLVMEMAGAKLDKPATGGFQMLTAREEQTDFVRVASTVYYFGERGAKNPTAMFMQQKNELEIIPQPYPREHSRYRANEDWKFLVRFNGQPLGNQKVTLETSNGSKLELATDAQGVLNLHMPDDFNTDCPSDSTTMVTANHPPLGKGGRGDLSAEQKPQSPSVPLSQRGKPTNCANGQSGVKSDAAKKVSGGHDHGVRRGAEFVLAVEHADNDKTYLTAFNSTYGADAYDKRNLAMGLGFALLGMAGAAPLLRQKKTEKKADTATDKKEEV